MIRGLVVEAAVESVAHARRAEADGADRLELCVSLSLGGLTPSAGLLRSVRAAVDLPIHVLVRPRPGDFIYTPDELAVMCADAREARRCGADALVVGCLTRDGVVDRPAMAALRQAAGTTPLVAHRAVDAAWDLAETIEAMADLGISRVLTSGGAPSAEQGLPLLSTLVGHWGERLTILAGGGVRAGNVRRIVEGSGVREVHVGFPEDAEPDRVMAVVAALR